jgi:hypothetical protein
MGIIRETKPVKLFVGIITSLPELIATVEDRLAEACGPIDVRSEVFPFDATHYYDREMGHPLRRRFVGFRSLIAPGEIAALKIRTNELEAALARDRTAVARPANLDPGYLEESKIVLASTKNYYHRIYVSDGIYAEVTLYWRDKSWHSLPWTFPDYRGGRYDGFFTELRRIYRSQSPAAK